MMGYAISIGSEVITWNNKKKINVSLSSTVAKYQVVCASTCEAIFFRRLLNDEKRRKKQPSSIVTTTVPLSWRTKQCFIRTRKT